MKIMITLSMQDRAEAFDIQVPCGQRIEETLQALEENVAAFRDIGNVKEVRESVSGRRISTLKSYEEAGIYSGMELLIPPQ